MTCGHSYCIRLRCHLARGSLSLADDDGGCCRLMSCDAGAAEATSPVVRGVERRRCRPFAFVADDATSLSAADV